MRNEKVYVLLKQRLNSPNNVLVKVFSTEEKAWEQIEKTYYNMMLLFDIQNVVIGWNSVTIHHWKDRGDGYKEYYITRYIIFEKDID